MQWDKGYTSSYYMTIIDPATWRDVDTVRITGGTVSRSGTGLMQSADIDCTELSEGVEKWIRIYLDTTQNGAHAHEALFTGLATSPGKRQHGWRAEYGITCYSVLKPCQDVVLPRGWYASGDTGRIIKDLLFPSPAPVEIADGAPTLTAPIIAEDKETNLTMLGKILTAIGWRLRIIGDGRVEATPQKEVKYVLGADLDVVETEISINEDWFKCPNVLRCTDGGLTAIARDDSLSSPLSTVNRGREVWASESNCDLAGESLAEYAKRRLKALQQIERTATYNRRYLPDLYPGDLVDVRYEALSGRYEVDKQTIKLGHAAATSEQIKTTGGS